MSSNATTIIEPFGSTGWSASTCDANLPFVYSVAFTAPVLELPAAVPRERILDQSSSSSKKADSGRRGQQRKHGLRSALQESMRRRGYDFNELGPWYFP
ncbi:hypothetical protein BDQ17DRAFT_1421853 [Cyathus striatus]|nr:hypothetical protein BDQ17DRAFT_1439378 [Cyathus striatus]KAF9009691.1 hypothetical protein BDQ17DRAFT_1421853 [Cyathus striatus]